MSDQVVQSAARQRNKVTFEQCVEAYEQVYSVHKAGRMLGVTQDTVHRRLRDGGYKLKAQWFSAEEDNQIIKAYKDAEIVELDALAKRLGRPKPNVCRRARELGCETKSGRPHKPETVAAMAKRHKKWMQENPHPRGALGLKHTEETKKVLSQKSLAAHKVLKREGRGVYSEENRQKHSDRMMKMRASMSANQVYSHAKRGVREDIGPIFFRSRWEANYARYLNWLQQRGEIDRWEYEPETFWFEAIKRGVRSYTPDFKIYEKGKPYFVEVKGWMDSKSKTKLKRMKKYHPDVTVILFGERDYKSLSQKLGKIIPNWE